MKMKNDYKRLLVLVFSLFLLSNCHSQTQQNRQGNEVGSAGTIAGEEGKTSSFYFIINKKSGLYLRPYNADAKNGIKIVLYPEHNWECLKWEADSVGDNSFYLQNLFTHKTFQPENEKTIPSKIIQQPLDKNNKLQQWSFRQLDNGYYSIRHTQSGLYLAAHAKGAFNRQVFLSEWEGREEQEWELRLTSAESDL
jgi:hypothetical protein